ncbi:MAG: DNA alkylation repair protein [Actinomycetota bacterium]
MPGHERLVAALRAMEDPAGVAGQARFGITGANRLGVRVTHLRRLARPHRGNHALALALWDSGVHEARLLATLIDDPKRVTKGQMERWVKALDSWDLVDGACMNLFDKTPNAFDKALEWSARRPEFQKRAGFALMAALAVHDKRAPDASFRPFLAAIVREANDERNFVRKAVNWALRSIGKRNASLNAAAIRTAEKVRALGSRPARWIASDALRELTSEAVRAAVRARS